MAHLNMTSPEGTCPSPLELVTSPRSCSHAGEGVCSSVHYSTLGVQFTQICGRAIGYQHHSTDAFSGFSGLPKNIDSPYVDGLSITYDTPRQHLWTYAAGWTDTGDADIRGAGLTCPCGQVRGAQPPSFVQDHYYCESGYSGGTAQDRWFADDPLWDGDGCPAGNTCCDPPNLPWFNRVINTSPAGIELRLCQDEGIGNEDLGLELFELYVY